MEAPQSTDFGFYAKFSTISREQQNEGGLLSAQAKIQDERRSITQGLRMEAQ